MSGKKVNTTIGIAIILLAIYMFILPINIEDFLNFNRYENMVVNALTIALYSSMILMSIVAIVFSIANRKESGLRNSYLILPLIILGFIVPLQYMAIIAGLAGLLVIYFTYKKNYVAIDSYFVFSIFLILILLIAISGTSTFFIKDISKIVQNEIEDSIGITEYDKEFFKYITPLDSEAPYINLSIKRDNSYKYGYIDNSGNTKIDFEYDFATPFYEIEAFDKKQLIAAVSKEDITEIILKNKRVVMSYISEYENYDYSQKLSEFENILKETFNVKDIKLEIEKGTTNISSIPVSPKEKNKDYTYRYKLNDEKEILVYESAVGNPTRYIMKDIKAPYAEMKLETANLIYDKDRLYTFNNKTIPFYDRDRNEQGWFMEDGEKITITGNAQVLDIEDDKVLIKHHSKNTAYFIDYNSKVISPTFRDVIVDQDRYLIRTMTDKWIITDKDFKKIFNEEFDIINTSLLSSGIYLIANLPENLTFNKYNYANISYMVITRKGHVILSNVEQIYDVYNQFTGDTNDEKEIEELRDYLKSVPYINIGDKFYKQAEELD